MLPDVSQMQAKITSILGIIQKPFWSKSDFWIFFCISLIGILFSLLAYIEAKKAKRAATEAGKIVKAQSIIIELTEISQKLDRLRLDINYNEGRELLTEITRRLRRIIVQYKNDDELRECITGLRETMISATEALSSVRPIDPSQIEITISVYYALESIFANLNYFVADLLGLFELRTTNTGDKNAKS